MRNLNLCTIEGRLTRPAEMGALPNGTVAAKFTLAVNDSKKGADGNYVEETSFLDFRAYGKQAENLRDYAVQGQSLIVTAKAKQQRWQDNTGHNRSAIVFFVQDFMLGAKPKAQQYQSAPQAQPQPQYQQPQQPQPPQAQPQQFQQMQQSPVQPPQYQQPQTPTQYQEGMEGFPEDVPF